MNDVYRGALVLSALSAFNIALRLMLVFIDQWSRIGRRYVVRHVAWLTLALAITGGIIIVSEFKAIGENHTLHVRDYVWGIQILAMILGLWPLWNHHIKVEQRRRHA